MGDYNSNYTGQQIDGALQAIITGSYKPTVFQKILLANGWHDGIQTLTDERFIASGYCYFVSPIITDTEDYSDASIFAKDVTVTGNMEFTCDVEPEDNLTVNILMIEVQ